MEKGTVGVSPATQHKPQEKEWLVPPDDRALKALRSWPSSIAHLALRALDLRRNSALNFLGLAFRMNLVFSASTSATVYQNSQPSTAESEISPASKCHASGSGLQ